MDTQEINMQLECFSVTNREIAFEWDEQKEGGPFQFNEIVLSEGLRVCWRVIFYRQTKITLLQRIFLLIQREFYSGSATKTTKVELLGTVFEMKKYEKNKSLKTWKAVSRQNLWSPANLGITSSISSSRPCSASCWATWATGSIREILLLEFASEFLQI